jgi:maltooligosyltrehalose synthase
MSRVTGRLCNQKQTDPSASCRLQFRNHVTFEAAIVLSPHLQNLGISHRYASPIFAAVEGSICNVVDLNGMIRMRESLHEVLSG